MGQPTDGDETPTGGDQVGSAATPPVAPAGAAPRRTPLPQRRPGTNSATPVPTPSTPLLPTAGTASSAASPAGSPAAPPSTSTPVPAPAASPAASTSSPAASPAAPTSSPVAPTRAVPTETAPAAPAVPVAPAQDEDAPPYQPSVRAYERRGQTAAGPRPVAPPTGAPTQAIPAVAGSWSAASGDVPSAEGEPPAGTGGSPLDGLAGDGAPSRWPRVLIGVGLGVVVLAGLYVGAQWLVADDVAKGTTVAGVDIGGLPAPEAVAALDAGLGPRAVEPVAVQAGDSTGSLDPAEAGLTLDSQATVDGLTGFTLDPSRLLAHVVGGDAVPPVTDVDRSALGATMESTAASLGTEPVDGTVRFTGGEPVATDAVDGTAVVVDAAEDAVTAGWLVTSGPIDLPTEPVPPAIDQAETDAALAVAQDVVSAPVTVDVGGQNPDLPERVLARSTSFVPQDGALVTTFDGERLTSAIVDRTDDLLTEPDDAHFEFVGGEPTIVGGETGTTLDPAQVAESVGGAATSTERTAQVELVEQDPEDTRESLEELGVQEVVSEFSTPLTSEPIRTKNLIRGAELVNGTLVKPDETFSLVDTLSPIEVSNGYFAAGVVNNGLHSEAVGGGLSQMATTTYNAGFFAGFDDVEHRQHSYWFTRYPAGREATIYVGSIDMKFKNDTPYGALMQAYVSGGRLHVKVWSTEYYDVETSDSGHQNVVPSSTIDRSGDPGCEAYPGGEDGFDITVYRKVYLEGDLVKDESDYWRYKPDDAVTCSASRSEADRDDPSAGSDKDSDGRARDGKKDGDD